MSLKLNCSKILLDDTGWSIDTPIPKKYFWRFHRCFCCCQPLSSAIYFTNPIPLIVSVFFLQLTKDGIYPKQIQSNFYNCKTALRKKKILLLFLPGFLMFPLLNFSWSNTVSKKKKKKNKNMQKKKIIIIIIIINWKKRERKLHYPSKKKWWPNKGKAKGWI